MGLVRSFTSIFMWARNEPEMIGYLYSLGTALYCTCTCTVRVNESYLKASIVYKYSYNYNHGDNFWQMKHYILNTWKCWQQQRLIPYLTWLTWSEPRSELFAAVEPGDELEEEHLDLGLGGVGRHMEAGDAGVLQRLLLVDRLLVQSLEGVGNQSIELLEKNKRVTRHIDSCCNLFGEIPWSARALASNSNGPQANDLPLLLATHLGTQEDMHEKTARYNCVESSLDCFHVELP